jgi:hypothetical protein
MQKSRNYSIDVRASKTKGYNTDPQGVMAISGEIQKMLWNVLYCCKYRILNNVYTGAFSNCGILERCIFALPECITKK